MFKIPSNLSLLVRFEDGITFRSDGKWLYPLFDLQDFLESEELSLDKAEVFDKVIGKAAALLLVYFDARRVHGDVMSDLAIKVFKSESINYSYDLRVDRITCRTETLLCDIDDPKEAFQILCQRAARC